jgi:Fe-Mn family superoxide dismutase
MYKLPKLNYTYSGLEPYIDRKTMRIHYTKHHQGYINKLNAYFKSHNLKKEDLRKLQSKIKLTETPLRNNGGGNFNHTFFWKVMTDKKLKRDINNYPEIKERILKRWHTLDNFFNEFENKALSVFGSGWAWLVINGKGKLEIVISHNQDNPLMKRLRKQKHGIPLLCLDVWEHAYYLKYQNKRNSYIRAFFNIINWDFVNENFEKYSK